MFNKVIEAKKIRIKIHVVWVNWQFVLHCRLTFRQWLWAVVWKNLIITSLLDTWNSYYEDTKIYYCTIICYIAGTFGWTNFCQKLTLERSSSKFLQINFLLHHFSPLHSFSVWASSKIKGCQNVGKNSWKNSLQFI